MSSPSLSHAAGATKIWCVLGIIGWAIAGFGYWAYSMVTLSVMNNYFPGMYGANDFAGVWCRTAIVVAPIALSCVWFRHARRYVYRISVRKESLTASTPGRVIAVNLPGILLGLVGGMGILALLAAAFS